MQNQAYGYFFPHGAFFALGHLAHVPPWVTQRLWWALLFAAGFWGVVRVAEALGIGSRGSRMIAAAAFALSPRVLTTIGSISSETLPMMLAPWVLLPVIRALDHHPAGGDGDGGVGDGEPPYSMRMLAARSAAAVALMGAVNAVATGFACLIAGIWWATRRPTARWRRFTAWWVPFLALACLWWLVPLWLLGRVSPPFLDFIESASSTNRFTSLPEVLRGTSSWTPFASPDTATGVLLVSEPVLVLATGLLAAAGLAGLAMRRMPARRRLLVVLFVGVAGLTIGYDGALGSAVAEQARAFLDGAGAPLRNVHKLDPLLRLPLVLGLAHLLGRVPMPGAVPWRRARGAMAHPEHEPMVAVTALVAAALVVASGVAWTAQLTPRGSYTAIPGYWHDAADWLAENAGAGPDASRALVVPGAPFAIQQWGMTRDEPLQALVTTPWAVRDVIPLTPPGAIRALDAVQRMIVSGRGSGELAPMLERMGIGYLVVRNDLDPQLAHGARPVVVHASIDGSPGLTRVAAFGESPVPVSEAGSGAASGAGSEAGSDDSGPDDSSARVLLDSGLRRPYPAVEIYRVGAGGPDGSVTPGGPGATAPVTVGPYAVDLDDVPVVAGGPAVLARAGVAGAARAGGRAPVILEGDAREAEHASGTPLGTRGGGVTVTDTPADREQNYGRVDAGASAIRALTDPRRTSNAVRDYPVPHAPMTRGEWHGAVVTASSSAADATQLGGVSPASSTAAAFDGSDETSWVSAGVDSAVGQWLQMDLDHPIRSGTVTLTTDRLAGGPPVTAVEVQTDRGTTGATIDHPGETVTVPLPLGTTSSIRITATATEDGSAGRQFGLSEVSVRTADGPVRIHRTVDVPAPAGDAPIARWSLGQQLQGRAQCVPAGPGDPDGPADPGDSGTAAPRTVLCNSELGGPPESPQPFTRTLSVPHDTTATPHLTVRARPGDDLDALLAGPVRASGESDVGDPRGNANAAVDGDPATSWHASSASAHHSTSSPTLTLHLPGEHTVSSLRIMPPTGLVPAAPTVVTVDLGTGPQQRTVPDDGIVELTPARTDTVRVSITDWEGVPVQGLFGRTSDAPPGIAGIAAFTGPGARGRIGGEPDPDRTITVGCDAGPVIDAGGRTLHTTITATARRLRDGDPVAAHVCGDSAGGDSAGGNIDLTAGEDTVTVHPGGAFTVDTLTLDTPQSGAHAGGADPASAATPEGETSTATPTSGMGEASPAAPPPDEGRAGTALPTSGWGDDHRVVDLPASDRERLLVVPESVNPGWVAHDARGRELTAVTVDGWQQGWVVPADETGSPVTVTLTFPSDRWYRIALFGGLALLPLLFLATAVPARRKGKKVFARLAGGGDRDASPAVDVPRRWPRLAAGAAGVAGVTVACAVVSGWAGVGVVAVLAAIAGAARATTRRRDAPRPVRTLARFVASGRAWPVLAGAAVMISMGVLATGPWLSGAPYQGHSAAAQLPALIGLAAAGLSAVRWPGSRRSGSQRPGSR